MRKIRLLAISAAVLLSGCYTDEVGLINIEVQDDLTTNVQIVVSPPDPVDSEETSGETEEVPEIKSDEVPETGEGWQQRQERETAEAEAEAERKRQYFEDTKGEFESCGFAAQKNLRYDEAGVSGSQSFSSRIDLEQAFSCLSYVTEQSPPIELNYPRKTENLFQTKYELQLGVKNPNFIFGYDGFWGTQKPVEEIRITLPGKIVGTEARNQSFNVSFNQRERELGIITLNVEEVDNEDSDDAEVARALLDELDIDARGFDYTRLNSEDEYEVQLAGEELIETIESQIGIDIDNDSEAFAEYVARKIPPYTTIVINSSQSKIDIGLTTAVVLGVLPFFISFLVFLYKKKNSQAKK